MWEIKTISSLGRVVTGKTPPKENVEYWDGAELFVSPKDMGRDSTYINKTEALTTTEALKKYKNQVLPQNSILYTCLSFGFGKIGIAPKKLLTNQQINSIIVNDQNDYRFVYYLLRVSTPFIFSYNSGIDTPIVPKSVFEKIKLSVPDLPKQKKIADILFTYDNLIENNNRRIELLEKAAQELYKEWFVRFRFPNHENTKFVKGLPEGWSISKISVLYSTTSGGTPSRANAQFYVDGKYDWIKTGELCDRFILDTEERITEEAVKNSSAKIIPVNSLILAMYGATIGKMGFTTKQSTCNQACCVFTPQKGYGSKYLYFWLLNNREYVISIGFGAAQQNLSQDLINKIKMLQPTESLVNIFEERIEPLFYEIKNLMKQNQNLKKQRDLLLPRLMSGRLEV